MCVCTQKNAFSHDSQWYQIFAYFSASKIILHPSTIFHRRSTKCSHISAILFILVYLCKCVHVMDVTQSEFQPDETDCFCLLVVVVVVNAESNTLDGNNVCAVCVCCVHVDLKLNANSKTDIEVYSFICHDMKTFDIYTMHCTVRTHTNFNWISSRWWNTAANFPMHYIGIGKRFHVEYNSSETAVLSDLVIIYCDAFLTCTHTQHNTTHALHCIAAFE